MARRPPGEPFSPIQREPRRKRARATKKSKRVGAAAEQHQSLQPDELHRQAAGADATTGIAAPLLAGTAVAIAGVVVQQPTALRWPGVAILLLVVAGSLLISAVQLGVLARRYGPSQDEVAAWRQAQVDPRQPKP